MDLSSVHRAMLAGPDDVLEWTREGLKQHMRTLVAAGLFHSDAEARRECMLQPRLLKSRTLRWYLERKAAVLEAGGSMDDVLAACCHSGSLQAAYPCLLTVAVVKVCCCKARPACAVSHLGSALAVRGECGAVLASRRNFAAPHLTSDMHLESLQRHNIAHLQQAVSIASLLPL